MTQFRVHTSTGPVDVNANSPAEAKQKVLAKFPDARITKIKIVKGE